MARPLRIQSAGARYHVTSRGNRKDPIFSDDPDRIAFPDILGDVVRRNRWLCHAYCLMGNHYHLPIETLEPKRSTGMRQLNGVAYRQFVRQDLGVASPLDGSADAFILGGEAFVSLYRAVLDADAPLDDVPRAQNTRYKT